MMSVELVAVTEPSTRLQQKDILTAEDLIVYAARVSNPSNQFNTDTGERLLRYCIRHGHWSVFETASMTVEIVTSRAISAQLIRHRSFTFQEFSQRYAETQGFEPVELRTQDPKNRQASGDPLMNEEATSLVAEAIATSAKAYERLLELGASRETARMVLPMATTTRLYMTGNVRSWIHYLQQRCAAGTQKEHRAVAERVSGIFNQQFPIVGKILNETDKQPSGIHS